MLAKNFDTDVWHGPKQASEIETTLQFTLMLNGEAYTDLKYVIKYQVYSLN